MLKEVIMPFIKENKLKLIMISTAVIIVCICFYATFVFIGKQEKVNAQKKEELSLITNEFAEEIGEESESQKGEYYWVDIKGAVSVPSVYQLEKGSRVFDVIKLAGGLTKEADTSVINLSKKIEDEMTILVYTKKEIDNFKQKEKEEITEVIKYIEKDCQCPDPIINDACISDSQEEPNPGTDNKMSINIATMEQLQTLPGIGESKAQDIIDYRNENGSFENIEDIKNVKGIGDSIFDKIKEIITI